MSKLTWNRIIFYGLGTFTGGILLGFFGGLIGRKG